MTSIYPASRAASPAVSSADSLPQLREGLHRAWVEVDLDAVRRNARRLRHAAGVPIVAMVKADGYGTGAVAVARALVGMGDDTVWGLGVATLAEARELRDAGISARILCCTPLLAAEHDDARAFDVRPALHRASDISAWCNTSDAPWHLAIDTGMARAGVRWDAIDALRDVVHAHPPEGVFTHFHSAEMPNGSRAVQDTRFDEALRVLALPEHVLVHRDNSAGIASRAGSAGSPGALARPGIGLYGAFVTSPLALDQVVHFRARVIDVRDVHDGESVSYGGTFVAHGTRRIATISAGHGDGYRQLFSNRGDVLLNGARVRVAGLVSMDMTMLDVTGVPCEAGDVATLIGSDGNDVLTTDAVAECAGMSVYELLVGLALRVPRVHYEAENA